MTATLREQDALDARVLASEEQLKSLDYNLQQLVLLNLAEDYLRLAEVHFSHENWQAVRSAMIASSEYFLRGFRYKNHPFNERYPDGPVKVRDKVMNPERGMRSLLIAMILDNRDKAQEAAKLIWDPPFCDYIGHGGACSYDEQKLAHAYRSFALQSDDKEAAMEDLDSVMAASNELSEPASRLKALFESNGNVSSELVNTWIEKANSDASLDLFLLGSIALATKNENKVLLKDLHCYQLLS